MRPFPHRHHAASKRKIRLRLDVPVSEPSARPIITARNLHYDVAAKTQAIAWGAIGAIQLLVNKLRLAEAIDEASASRVPRVRSGPASPRGTNSPHLRHDRIDLGGRKTVEDWQACCR